MEGAWQAKPLPHERQINNWRTGWGRPFSSLLSVRYGASGGFRVGA